MTLSNVNLNEVVINSNWRDKITKKGHLMFREAFANNDIELMRNLLSRNIGFNEDMEEIFAKMIENNEFELLHSIIKDYKNFTNLNYKGECLLNLILNMIIVYEKELEMSKSKEDTIISILKSINFKYIEGYTMVNCLTNYNVCKYLSLLVDRGFNFSDRNKLGYASPRL